MDAVVPRFEASRWLDVRCQLTAFAELIRLVGLRRALRLGIELQRSPDPYLGLPAPSGPQDEGTRVQIRDAIRLYRLLLARCEREEALRIVRRVVEVATVAFLEGVVGPIDVAWYRSADESGRRSYVAGLMERIPNADVEVVESSPERFVQRIVRCRFVELCADCGVPELASAFCRGDKAFFARSEVDFERPDTLAEGGACCEMRFSMRA